jgi:uncharacterized membrane protein YdjX (TVP38/TMEM64 family)
LDFSKSDLGLIKEDSGLIGNFYVNILTTKLVGVSLTGAFGKDALNYFTELISKKTSVLRIDKNIIPYPSYLSSLNNLQADFIQYMKSNYKSIYSRLVKDHLTEFTTAFFWLITASLLLLYLFSINFSQQVIFNDLSQIFNSPFGPVIYILTYVFRAFISFPATVITVLGTAIFGFWPGLALILVGSNLSSVVAYFLGKTVFSHFVDHNKGLVTSLKENSFLTVLIARFTFFPYDLLSYISGFLRINFKSFIVATAIGSIPGSLAFASLGASLSSINDIDNFKIDYPYLLLGLILFLGSLILSKIIKKYYPDSFK